MPFITLLGIRLLGDHHYDHIRWLSRDPNPTPSPSLKYARTPEAAACSDRVSSPAHHISHKQVRERVINEVDWQLSNVREESIPYWCCDLSTLYELHLTSSLYGPMYWWLLQRKSHCTIASLCFCTLFRWMCPCPWILVLRELDDRIQGLIVLLFCWPDGETMPKVFSTMTKQ